MDRPSVEQIIIESAICDVRHAIQRAVDNHGRGACASTHETLGIVTEEYYELIKAVHHGPESGVESELLDIAAACVFGIASIRAEGGGA